MMKRSPSELALQEVIRKMVSFSDTTIHDPNSFFFIDNSLHQMYQGYDREEETNILLSTNHTPKGCTTTFAATHDSQSSICGGNLSTGSPLSGNNQKRRMEKEMNEARGAMSGSSHDHDHDHDQDQLSDDEAEVDVDIDIDEEEVETDAGHSEKDPTHLKRIRRMLSNRESARRSRKRKQEHLADLELQAEQLRGENDSLYKQLTNAHHQYRDADTNNRVLKSDVEALRAKVKLAEDMLARGSLTCSLNQLVQSHLASSPQPIGNLQRRVANVSPTITVTVDDSSSYGPPGLTVSGNSALSLDIISTAGNLNNGACW